MTTNTDPVRAVIADWREEAAECHAESETPAVKRDPRAYAGFASASRILTRCADEAEAALASAPPSAPVGVAGNAADGWQHLAADWLEQQAEEQEATNAEYPKHAAAYSEWRDRPVFLRMLAGKVKNAEGSIKRHCPPPSWMFPDDGGVADSRNNECACTRTVAVAAPQQPAGVDEVLAAVRAEVVRATSKFPTWPTDPLHASGVVQEEAGELAKAVLQAVYEPHKSNPEDVAAEAVQTAAMAVRFLLSMPHYDWTPGAQHAQE